MDNIVQGGLSNTRPENTTQGGLRAVIDWVSITFRLPTTDNEDWTSVFAFCGLDISHNDLQIEDWGNNTFTSHARYERVKIQRKNTDTYQLELTGQGCRDFEIFSRLSWLDLFLLLKDFADAKATRIDIALDDFGQRYTVNMIRRTWLDGRCVSYIRDARTNNGYRSQSDGIVTTMDSWYIGSINSRLSINFYDKALEQENAKEDSIDKSIGDYTTWTRTEIRCKKEYADDVIDLLLLHDGQLQQVITGILAAKIRFIAPCKKNKDKNKSRRPTISWWANFIKDAQKLNLTLLPPTRTIERAKKWVERSVAPTLAMLHDLDPVAFSRYVNELIADGQSRLSPKHYDMMDQYQRLAQKERMASLRSLASDMDKDIELKLQKIAQKKTLQERL